MYLKTPVRRIGTRLVSAVMHLNPNYQYLHLYPIQALLGCLHAFRLDNFSLQQVLSIEERLCPAPLTRL